MGPTLLIACLWGVVLVYWLWSRRPLGDPVGSFRNELRVLGSATPARVAPANRLCASPPAFVSASQKRVVDPSEPVARPVRLAAAAHSHTCQEVRRRRRDVIFVLAVAALLSLFAAVLTGSALVVFVQVLVDVALVTYVYLLLTRTAGGQSKTAPSASRDRDRGFVKPAISTARTSTARLAGANHVRGDIFGPPDWEEPSYGDFGSYASLAMSRGS
jgi:hypothetical protein